MKTKMKYFKVIRHRTSPQSDYYIIEYHRANTLENVEKKIDREHSLYGSNVFLKGKEVSKKEYTENRFAGTYTKMPKL